MRSESRVGCHVGRNERTKRELAGKLVGEIQSLVEAGSMLALLGGVDRVVTEDYLVLFSALVVDVLAI